MCVFTDKKGKTMALALVPIIAINIYAGCKIVKNQTRVEQPNSSIESVLDESDILEDSYLEYGDVLVDGVTDHTTYDEIQFGVAEPNISQEIELDYVTNQESEISKLERIYNNSKLSIEFILENEYRDSELYVSALLAKLRNAHISEEIIREELNNIIVYGSNATCMSDDEWNRLFGNLGSTISIYDNVVDYYYPLAKYFHLSNCSLEHSPLYFDEYRITCLDIQELYDAYNPQIDIKDYFRDMVSMSQDIRLIKQLESLINSGIDFDTILCELENVYMYARIPMCVPEEEWEMAFGNLLKTIDYQENVCLYYYDLAFYIHELWCDFEHTLNEFGKYECDIHSKVLEI